jgi:hypothetical protein
MTGYTAIELRFDEPTPDLFKLLKDTGPGPEAIY